MLGYSRMIWPILCLVLSTTNGITVTVSEAAKAGTEVWSTNDYLNCLLSDGPGSATIETYFWLDMHDDTISLVLEKLLDLEVLVSDNVLVNSSSMVSVKLECDRPDTSKETVTVHVCVVPENEFRPVSIRPPYEGEIQQADRSSITLFEFAPLTGLAVCLCMVNLASVIICLRRKGKWREYMKKDVDPQPHVPNEVANAYVNDGVQINVLLESTGHSYTNLGMSSSETRHSYTDLVSTSRQTGHPYTDLDVTSQENEHPHADLVVTSQETIGHPYTDIDDMTPRETAHSYTDVRMMSQQPQRAAESDFGNTRSKEEHIYDTIPDK